MWINVKKKLPEHDKWVLVKFSTDQYDDEEVLAGKYNHDTKTWCFSNKADGEVTFWLWFSCPRAQIPLCFYCKKDRGRYNGLCTNCNSRLQRNGTLEYLNKNKKRITDRELEIYQLYKSGMSQSEISRKLGITKQSVSSTLKSVKNKTVNNPPS